jgi:hypothetical protein
MHRFCSGEENRMRASFLLAAIGLVSTIGAFQPAQAAGCIKGALVGGVAGHLAHHGVLGAVGGCAVGHHMAAQKQKQADQQMQQQPPPNGTAPR